MGDAYSDSKPDRPFPSTADITNGIFLAKSYDKETHSANIEDIKDYLFSLVEWNEPLTKKEKRHWNTVFDNAIRAAHLCVLLEFKDEEGTVKVIMRT